MNTKLSLDKIVSFEKTYSFSRAIEGEGKYRHIHYGDIHTKLPSVIEDSKILPEITEENEFQTIEKGDILVADASEDYKDLGKAVCYMGDDNKVIAGLHTHLLRCDKTFVSPEYLINLFQTNRYKKFVWRMGTGVSVLGLSKNNLGKYEVLLPTLEEQKQKAKFFIILNKKIQLQQQKIDLLQEQKKGFLQKMFPKAGETQPEIRFDGFAEKWEQNRLGEYGYFYYGKSAPKWSLAEDANTPCVRYGELYTKFGAKIDKIYSYTTIPKENLKFSTGNEVLVPRVGEDPLDFSKCSWLSISDVAIGEMISVYNTTQNPQFMAIYFRAKMKYEFAKRVEGGNVSNLYYSYLEDILLTVPSLQEQKKICSFFEKLDDNINSQKEKLEFLQKQKQGFMQQMFI